MNVQQTLPVRQTAAQYLADVQSLLAHVDISAIEKIVQCLENAHAQGAMIYVAGNGGSAATATHWVNDLNKAARRDGQPHFRSMSLCTNLSWLTALANDEGYERVFSGQLENFARAGDVLVVISASGNSPNLVSAVELARQRGLATIGFLGFDGGVLKKMVTHALWLPTDKGAYGLVEDGCLTICHLLTTCLRQSLGGSADQ